MHDEISKMYILIINTFLRKFTFPLSERIDRKHSIKIGNTE